MKLNDIIVFKYAFRRHDEDPEEFNFFGIIMKEEIMYEGDKRMPSDIITPYDKPKPDEKLGIKTFYILWSEPDILPELKYNRADYIEKWYETIGNFNDKI